MVADIDHVDLKIRHGTCQAVVFDNLSVALFSDVREGDALLKGKLLRESHKTGVVF